MLWRCRYLLRGHVIHKKLLLEICHELPELLWLRDPDSLSIIEAFNSVESPSDDGAQVEKACIAITILDIVCP